MRIWIVILLWIALGYWYHTISRDCCADQEIPVKTELPAQKETQSSSLLSTTKYSFLKSSVVIDQDDYNAIQAKLPLQGSEGIVITGYAYSGEENPHQLALLRAKEVRNHLDIPEPKIQLRARVLEANYSGANDFIGFELYELTAEELRAGDGEEPTFNGILHEGKSIHFYLDSYEKGLSEIIKIELAKAANKLRNNFCKITLVSYNDDLPAGSKLCYDFKEQLIRSGLNPSRISTKSMKQGDRNASIVELRIVE